MQQAQHCPFPLHARLSRQQLCSVKVALKGLALAHHCTSASASIDMSLSIPCVGRIAQAQVAWSARTWKSCNAAGEPGDAQHAPLACRPHWEQLTQLPPQDSGHLWGNDPTSGLSAELRSNNPALFVHSSICVVIIRAAVLARLSLLPGATVPWGI